MDRFLIGHDFFMRSQLECSVVIQSFWKTKKVLNWGKIGTIPQRHYVFFLMQQSPIHNFYFYALLKLYIRAISSSGILYISLCLHFLSMFLGVLILFFVDLFFLDGYFSLFRLMLILRRFAGHNSLNKKTSLDSDISGIVNQP